MGYRIARGDSIALAWLVRAGDPTTVASVTAKLRPALASDPTAVDPAQSGVSFVTPTLVAASGDVPAYWLATISAATSLSSVPAGNYLADLRFVFTGTSDVANSDLCPVTIYEPATIS